MNSKFQYLVSDIIYSNYDRLVIASSLHHSIVSLNNGNDESMEKCVDLTIKVASYIKYMIKMNALWD